jgi:hypothetical protein
LDAVQNLIYHIDLDYCSHKLRGGFNSSEALIAEITDEVTKVVNTKTGPETEIVEEGVLDTRLVVVEKEFSRILEIGKRNGTTLSEILREFYDLPFQVAASSRRSSLVSTNPFVSILGHITPEALRSSMPTVEAFNGFANRLTYIASRRIGSIPEPPVIDWKAGRPQAIVERLKEILKTFRPCNSDCSQNLPRGFGFSYEAGKQWKEVYYKLSEESRDKSGLVAAIIARAKPTILRLAMIYAALYRGSLIEPRHLSAASALWDYAARSALWAFGSASGNVDADKILKYLRRCGDKRASRSKIRNEVFGGHKAPAALTEDLSLLKQSGLAVMRRVKKADLWFSM